MYQSPWDRVEVGAPKAHLIGVGDPDLVLRPGGDRAISVNGAWLDASALLVLAGLEQELRFRLDDGHYWYDGCSGAFGRNGGPTASFLPTRLPLGGAMLPRCSGTGSDVFVNGRELHDVDVRSLARRLGRPPRGSYRMYFGGWLFRADGGRRWNLAQSADSSAA